MVSLTSLSSTSLVRLLGHWRSGSGRGAAYRQLHQALRLLILDGRLPLGVRLPGERELAAALALSRTTITAAYSELKAEGFLTRQQGSGSVTSLPTGPGARADLQLDPRGRADLIDLSIASLPATELVYDAYAAALAALPAHLPGSGYGSSGLPELRETVAKLYARRGVPTTPDQILVTQGAQHGFVLLLELLASPGDRIVVDQPTYPLALDAVQRAACRAVPVSLSEQGWDPDAFASAFRHSQPRMAYLLPDFHNPTGLLMDDAARAALVAAAAKTGTLLVTDETMAELWIEGRRPTPLAAWDRNGVVISVGSTSKTFWGGLRVGWIRADARHVAALSRLRASRDLGSPILEQLAASFMVSRGDEVLDARRAGLRARRDHLIETAARLLPDWRLSRPPGGLTIWAELPAPASTLLAVAAESEGVRIAPGTRFGVDGAFERFVRLPFALPEERLREAIRRLAAAWRRTGGLAGAADAVASVEAAQRVI